MATMTATGTPLDARTTDADATVPAPRRGRGFPDLARVLGPRLVEAAYERAFVGLTDDAVGELLLARHTAERIPPSAWWRTADALRSSAAAALVVDAPAAERPQAQRESLESARTLLLTSTAAAEEAMELLIEECGLRPWPSDTGAVSFGRPRAAVRLTGLRVARLLVCEQLTPPSLLRVRLDHHRLAVGSWTEYLLRTTELRAG